MPGGAGEVGFELVDCGTCWDGDGESSLVHGVALFFTAVDVVFVIVIIILFSLVVSRANRIDVVCLIQNSDGGGTTLWI
jgi:hypothetical protein